MEEDDQADDNPPADRGKQDNHGADSRYNRADSKQQSCRVPGSLMQPLANQECRQGADQQSDELQPLNAQTGSVGQPIHEIRPDSVGGVAIRVSLNVALDHGRSSSAGGKN